MRIAFAGTGRLGVELLSPLLESNHQVVALLQNGRLTKGYKRTLHPFVNGLFGASRTTMGMARKHGIPIFWIDKMNEEELAPLRALEPDLLLVGGFGIILKAPLLRIPKIGCVNTHSALLPRHRGPNPFTAVILANEPETGVTFHVMDEGIDTGNILEQIRVPVGPKATSSSVYRETSDVAGQHVLDLIDRIESEGLQGRPQDPSLATYEGKLTPADVCIDWTQSAEEIERLTRAAVPFLFPRFVCNGRLIYIGRCRYDSAPVDAEPGTILAVTPRVRIATGHGSLTILVGYAMTPFPWLWPAPWTRPAVGTVVE